MARDHARLQTAIWRDRDFRALEHAEQHMYFTLCSQQTLTYCGVMDWWPGRLASLAADVTEAHVYAAVQGLIDKEYVCLDVETSELLVRTYVRHDNVLQRHNMGKAMGRALEKVVSLDLRDVIFSELARLRRDDQMLAGWDGFKELFPKEYEKVISMALAMASK